MTRLLLIMFLLLSAAPVYAKWVKVGSADQGKVISYADPETIRRKGNVVKMWALKDYQAIQIAGGKSFLSQKVQWEFDCTEEQSRNLAWYEYAGQMGTGEIVDAQTGGYPSKWAPVVPESIGQASWEFACKKQ